MNIFKKLKKNNENENTEVKNTAEELSQSTDAEEQNEVNASEAEEENVNTAEPAEETINPQEIPEEAKRVIEEAQKIAQNPDAQIRFVIEHKILPSKVISDPIYVITSIIADKGNYINNFYNSIYAQNKLEPQYAPEDFAVSAPFKISGANAVKIEMPSKNLFPSLCKRVYIAYNDHFSKYLYITIEAIADDAFKMGAWIDGEHEEYGPIEGSEEEMLAKIIEDEEIAEGTYSDVLTKLMSGTSPAPNGLLSDPAEISKHMKIFANALMQSQKFKQEGRRDEALKLIREVIRQESVKYNNTPDLEFHCFANAFEVMLYANLYHPYNPETNQKKQLAAMQVDLSAAYLFYGAMMLEKQQYDKAIDILWKAVEANPVNVQLMFALADAYKGKRYLKSFCEIIKKAHLCAFKKVDIARIYRNLAYYYTEIKEYEIAAALCFASKYFDKNPQGFNFMMNKLKEASGEEYNEPSLDELKKTLMQNGISWGVKELAVSVVKMLNQQFTQANNEQGIKMCSDIMKEMTLD